MSDDYQVRKDIDRLIGSVYNLESGDESFYTKIETEDLLHSNYYEKDEVDSLLDEEYYNKSETDDLLDNKIDTDTVYTKTESDNRYQQKSNGLVQVKQRVWSDTNNLTYTLYVDEVNRNCTLTLTSSDTSIANGVSNYEVSRFVPAQYRSKSSKFQRVGRTNAYLLYMWNNGSVGIANLSGSSQSGQAFNAQIDWNY